MPRDRTLVQDQLLQGVTADQREQALNAAAAKRTKSEEDKKKRAKALEAKRADKRAAEAEKKAKAASAKPGASKFKPGACLLKLAKHCD